MAENENFSANIEVNVDLNTKMAEDKLKQLAEQAAKTASMIEDISSGKKLKRPGKSSDMLSGANADVLASVLGQKFKVINDALFKGVETGIKQLDSLAKKIADAGYRLDIVAKTGEVQLVRSKTGRQQSSSYLSKQKFQGADAITSGSAVLSEIDATKLRQQILKELQGLGFTGIKKYIVGQVKAATEAEFSGAVQLDGIEGMSWAEDVSQINAQFINENAKRVAKFIGQKFSEGENFLETGMATHLQGSKPASLTKKNINKPGLVNPDQLAASSDFVPGDKGVPIISAEIFALASELALANITKASPADFAISENNRKELFDKIDKVIGDLLVDAVDAKGKTSGTAAIQGAIEQIYQPGDLMTASKRGQSQKVSPAEQNKRLIEQFNILSPQAKIKSFDDIIEQYFAWVIENKIVPSLEATAHKSVKKMAQGNSRYNDMLSAGDQGAENFQEYQQRAVTTAIPDLASKYGVPVQSIAGSGALRENPLLESMVRIAAVSGEVATSMRDIDKEFYDTEEHLKNFNTYLKAIIADKLPESGMTQRELGAAARKANAQVGVGTTTAPVTAVTTQAANTVVDAQLAALQKAYAGDKMQQMKKIVGAESFDKIFAFIENTIKAGGKFTDVIAGWDTEFSPALAGVANTILESSLVLRNAKGDFVDLQTFMHRPAYQDPQAGLGGVAGINQKMYLKDPSSGISSVAAFMKRAADLGIPESELGDIKNAANNTAQASKKFQVLQALFVALDDLNIPLTGQKIIGADFAQFKKTMDWLSKFTDEIHLTTGLSNVSDNLSILKKMQTITGKNDPGMSIAGSKGTDLSQSAIVQSLFKKFPSEMQKYSDFIQPTQNGFKVTINNQEFKAHTAQADAVASIIVNEVMNSISPMFASLMQGGQKAYLPQNSEFRGAQFPYSKKSMGNSKIQVDPQQREAAANDLVRATRQEDDAQRQLIKTMTGMNVAVPLFEHIRAIISGTAGDIDQANAALKPLYNTMVEMIKIQKAGLTGRRLNANEKFELERINKLQAAFNDLHDATISKGNKVAENGVQLKKIQSLITKEYGDQIKEVERLKKLQEEPKQDKVSGKGYYTLGDAVMQPFKEAQAGSVFGKEIQAQMKEYVAREKQVESANKNLINTWVTARYALYDVANAYQNVSRNLFMATRAMFNMTQSYRSFETAFTPVERAMSLTSMEVVDLRDQFVKLSEQIPVSFQDLASVATLGAQMGVTADGIVKFTTTVTKFASVTGVSADTVAQKFGRIAQLTKLDPTQFENLGSAISYAGVNAVATEAEILSLSESIAASSNRVGITADQVVGLSTSLASLGIAPEQARGVFTRVFADIDRAVAKGGSQLDEFSKVSGMSSDNFKKQWGTPGQSYEVFRRILEGLNKSGKGMTQTFDDLNLTETREVNTLTRLATNLDVVDSSMQNATSSFAANTFLSDSFSKTVDNLDSKLKIFQNRIDSLAASLSKGFAAGLGGLLDYGTKLADMLKILADNPLIQAATTGIAGMLALGAVGSGLVSVFAKVVAQIYAFRVASINAANDPTAVVGWNKQLKALTNFKSEIIEMRDQISLSASSSSLRGQIQPVDYPVSGANDRNKYLLETERIYRATGEAAIKSANDAGAAHDIKKMAAFESLTWARKEADQINHIVAIRAVEIAQMQAATAEKVAAGTMTAAQAEAIMVEARSRQINYEWINGEAKAVSLENELKAVGISTSGRVTKAKQAEAAAHLENKLAIEAETRAGAVGKGGILGGMGAKIMGVAGGIGLAITAATTLYSIFELIRGSIEQSSKFNLLESGGGVSSLREAIKKDTAEYEKSGKAIRTVVNETQKQGEAIDDTKVKIGQLVGVQDNLNTNIATGTGNIKTQTMAIGENTKAWVANALIQNEKLQEILKNSPSLLKDLSASGVDFQKTMSDILSGKDVNSGLDAKIDQLNKKLSASYPKAKNDAETYGQALGIADNAAQKSLRRQIAAIQAIRSISGELGTSLKSATQEAQVSSIITQLLGVEDAADGANGQVKTLTKTLRTLSNYADDVGSVFTNMLKFKFEKQNALAETRAAVDGVNKGIKDATKNLRDLNNTLTTNSKQKKKLEVAYQLAVQFGDTQAAKDIADQIASVDAELANNQSDISYNTQLLSGTLDTSTQAGRDNDKTLQGLITTSGEYIKTLIDAGRPADEINQAITDQETSFYNQAAAMGISTEAAKEYAKAFTGFRTILKGVDKGVNVKADTDPAKRALNEFIALANGTTVEVKIAAKPAGVETNSLQITQGLSDGAKLQDYKDKRDMYYRMSQDTKLTPAQRIKYSDLASTWGTKYTNFVGQLAKAGKGKMNVTMLASGGFVSGSGSSTGDKIPAMLSNGEFVIRAKSVSRYGLDFMNSLNQQRVGYAPMQQMQNRNGNNGSSVVYLSSRDRELLQAVIDRPITLRTSNRVIAESANDGNKELARRGAN
ncbi:Phage tail tape measure protein [uncultured Caudovirales phage]|uniref:Phage tail tape measure protein n=1 Tax=uncultured Caudovirales phage TaxID=2100421 RepID=A0A6J5MQK7_9CAUD|nr:Phage tail tape measure protein [uncultured Caudovirales phage]